MQKRCVGRRCGRISQHMMMMNDKTPFQTPHEREREDPLLQHPKNVIPSQSKKDAIDRIEFISLIGIPSTPSFAIHPYPIIKKEDTSFLPASKKRFTGKLDTICPILPFDDREIFSYSRIPLLSIFWR